MAQGLELQRPGKGSRIRALSKRHRREGSRQGRTARGLSHPAQLRGWGWGCGGVPGGCRGTGLRKPRRLG